MREGNVFTSICAQKGVPWSRSSCPAGGGGGIPAQVTISYPPPSFTGQVWSSMVRTEVVGAWSVLLGNINERLSFTRCK